MFIGIRKRDNVKEGVLLPIEKGRTLKFSANSYVSDCIAPTLTLRMQKCNRIILLSYNKVYIIDKIYILELMEISRRA